MAKPILNHEILKRYKKPIIFGAIALGLSAIAAVVIAGALLYQAANWIADTRLLTQQNSTIVADGLRCVNALGGPEPLNVVAFVKSKTADPVSLETLHVIERDLSEQASQNTPHPCTELLLNT